jgi:hypothetical protein
VETSLINRSLSTLTAQGALMLITKGVHTNRLSICIDRLKANEIDRSYYDVGLSQ